MNQFNWAKAIGFGAIIWVIAAVVLWALNATSLPAGWIHGIVAAVTGLAAYLFALNAKPQNPGEALGYGIVWVAIGIAFDALFIRVLDAHVFTTWQYYVGYGLALLAPLLGEEMPSTHRAKPI